LLLQTREDERRGVDRDVQLAGLQHREELPHVIGEEPGVLDEEEPLHAGAFEEQHLVHALVT